MISIVVIKGMTKMAVFDYEKKRITRIPKEFLEKINK